MDKLHVWIVSLFLPVVTGMEATTRQVVALYHNGSSGAIYTEHLRWAKTTRSVLECHVKCVTDVGCAAFTFTPDPVETFGLCRAHDKNAGEDNTKVNAPRSVTYRLPGRINITDLPDTENVTSGDSVVYACNGDADCPGNNWICVQGVCQCQLGAYYSISSVACVSTCSSEDLQSEFVSYPGMWIRPALLGLSWFPLFTLNSVSQAQCTAECLSRTSCFSINHDSSTLVCQGISKDALLLSLSYFDTVAAGVYMQRMCA